jgi:NTE family protein
MSLLNTFREKPFHLALSSGFFGFYAHVGFLKAIHEFDLKPASYSGSSAGAIVAAAAAKGLTLQEIESLITGVSRKDFWDPSFGLGLLRGRKLQTLLESEIGSDFNSLSLPMRIPVFDILTQRTHVFTSGNLARAIRASCAVPLMFHPVKIERRLYWDGGIADKMAIHGISVDQKILSHYLESTSRDPHSIYELKRDLQTSKAREKNLLLMQLKKLPSANPFAMHRGPEIIEAAYRQTVSVLKSYS